VATRTNRVPAFCPNCGSANASGGLRCIVCGQQFVAREEMAALWDVPGSRPSQTPLSPAEDFDDDGDRFADSDPGEDDSLFATRPITPLTDRWSSSAGRLGAEAGSPQAFVAPGLEEGRRRNGGPPAFLLGLLGLLLILGVAAAVAVLVVGPVLSAHIETRTRKAVQTSLAGVNVLPEPTAGTVVVTEAEIRTMLKARAQSLKPISDPSVQLSSKGFTITFSVYGYNGTLTGKLAVENGRIVIVDPKLDGLADRVLDMNAIAGDIEAQLNSLLDRNNLTAVSIQSADDSITVKTAPKAP
jgi:hypothetical protein